MNYINNPLNMCCCGFSEMDNIRVERRTVLVDAVSNKICELGDVTLGHSYDCEERWALVKSYTVIAYYPTKNAARTAYNNLVAELAIKDRVLSVSEART